MSALKLFCGLVIAGATASRARAAENQPKILPPEPALGQTLKEIAVRMAGDADLQKRIAPILAEARRVRDLPLVRRARSLDELKNPPADRRLGGIDARTYVVTKSDPRKAELFALASADLDATSIIAREMPLLAAAFVLTGDQAYADRVAAQSRELSSWKPLQRPGWMLYKSDNSLPPDGNDGVWLSTGVGLIALCQTLEIMPKDSLPPDVRAEIRQQLADECQRIITDWKAKKMWFVKSHVPTTNQWVVPAAGLTVAAATLGRDVQPEAYKLGLQNLQETISALGTDGGVAEGIEYGAQFTAPYLYLANHYLRLAGDDQLAQVPFLKNFPTWLCANFQPAQSLVNASDSFGTNRGMYPAKAPNVAQAAVLSRSPYLLWLLREQIHTNVLNMYGFIAAATPASELQQPPLWSSFDTGRCVMWRNSWNDDASGVWIRGGGSLAWSGHEHWDRGHVNFISRGKIVLLEAGTAGYDSPIKQDAYDSLRGHNVLQIGDDVLPKKGPASLTINAINASGGDVTVDATACYPQAKRWERRVVWNVDRMEITDRVELQSAQPILFRWHLGSQQALTISAMGNSEATASLPPGTESFRGWNGNLPAGIDWVPPEKDILQTPGANVSISADRPVVCEQEKNYDHTIKFRVQKHEHTTLVVRSAEPVAAITIKTVIQVP